MDGERQQMKNIYKNVLGTACACAVSVSALTISTDVMAANWLMLQGTERASAAQRARVWGFIQPEYQYTEGTKVQAGPFKDSNAQFNQIRPDLKTNSSFNLLRARIGVRGEGFPLDSNVNYFILAEFGNNGITRQGGGSAKITDASVTLSHIPHLRLRFGTFKYPGSEEGLQAIHVFDYINFTNVSNQLLLERFFDCDGSGTACGANRPNGPVGAFRDTGIQLFDSFSSGGWEHTYAVMVGNGNGISRGDNDKNKDSYVYWSSERVFGGQGPRRQGWKLYAWGQNGKRTILDETVSSTQTSEYDRTRWGVGSTFRKSKYRAAFEYIAADGMIQNGTDFGAVAGSVNGGGIVASWNILPEDKANGYYVDFGYLVTPVLELDARYDVLNRATKVAANERKFDTLTLGAQYFFNKKTRMILNYEFRNAEAPNLPGSHTANQILDSIDDRASLQVLAIF